MTETKKLDKINKARAELLTSSIKQMKFKMAQIEPISPIKAEMLAREAAKKVTRVTIEQASLPLKKSKIMNSVKDKKDADQEEV